MPWMRIQSGVFFALTISYSPAWADSCGPAGVSTFPRANIEMIRDVVLGRQDVCNVRVTGSGGRIFKFNSRGDLTVSLGEKSGPPVTVCQFRILPTGDVGTGVLNDGTVKSSGIEWSFDSAGNLSSSNGCRYELDPSGNVGNNCGFRITECRGKVVFAWKPKVLSSAKERTPEGDPSAFAQVISPSGAKGCSVNNNRILSHQRSMPTQSHPLCGKNGAPPQDRCTERENGTSDQGAFDENPKNKSGGELSTTLTSACGGNWNFLRGSIISGVGGGEASQ